VDYRRLCRFELRRFREHFARFAWISVRDSWTQGLFERILPDGRPPPIVPDPVWGLEQTAAEACFHSVRQRFQLPEKYVLASFPQDARYSAEWLEAFKEECGRHGHACLSLPLPRGNHIRFRDALANVGLPLTPMEWYALLANAAGYVGLNMHPLVVCLSNAVPIFSFDPYGFYSAKKGLEPLAASKVFDLLNRSSLLDWYHNAWWPSWPQPEIVFERLQAFNRERCRQLAAMRKGEFETALNTLVQSLQ